MLQQHAENNSSKIEILKKINNEFVIITFDFIYLNDQLVNFNFHENYGIYKEFLYDKKNRRKIADFSQYWMSIFSKYNKNSIISKWMRETIHKDKMDNFENHIEKFFPNLKDTSQFKEKIFDLTKPEEKETLKKIKKKIVEYLD